MESILDILKRLNNQQVLDLDTLLLAKQAMNSPKDRQVALELSAIRERLLHPDKN
jgi:hypothetical protein